MLPKYKKKMLLKALRKGRAVKWSLTWATIHLRSRIGTLSARKTKEFGKKQKKYDIPTFFESVNAHPSEVRVVGCNGKW